MNNMKVNEYINNLLDNDIVVSDDEIKALADLSHRTKAWIRELYSDGKYFMIIKFNDEDEEILLASCNKDRYGTLSKEFFRKFVEYGGNIELDNIF